MTTRQLVDGPDLGDPWVAVLDSRVTEVITQMCQAHQPGQAWTARQLFAAVAATISHRGLPGGNGRHGAARQRLVCLAAVYGRYFRPDAAWTLTDADLGAGVLTWTHRCGTRLLDAPRTGHTSAALVTPGATAAARAGGPRLAGVRLLALTAPLRSALLTPRGQLEPLPDLHSLDLHSLDLNLPATTQLVAS